MTRVAAFNQHIQAELDGIRAAGLFKSERIIATPQGALVKLADGRELINLCANNYLGLSSHPQVIAAAHEALRTHGYGMSSVRFICGTQDIHKQLEQRLAAFLGTEDTILYAAAFDANGGLFEPLLARTTPSSATRSTTRPSSTASACARPSASATRTTTWPTSRRS